MEILKKAAAGTMESSDVYVEIEPGTGTREILLDSVVLEQFGDDIYRVVNQVLDAYAVENASLRVYDRGALECVIRARVETAVLRGKENA